MTSRHDFLMARGGAASIYRQFGRTLKWVRPDGIAYTITDAAITSDRYEVRDSNIGQSGVYTRMALFTTDTTAGGIEDPQDNAKVFVDGKEYAVEEIAIKPGSMCEVKLMRVAASALTGRHRQRPGEVRY